MLAANSLQINFYTLVMGIKQPLCQLGLDIAVARLPASKKSSFCALTNARQRESLIYHGGYIKCGS